MGTTKQLTKENTEISPYDFCMTIVNHQKYLMPNLTNLTYLNMPYVQEGFENYCDGEIFKTEIEILKTKLI